jgi:hypothetical protein
MYTRVGQNNGNTTDAVYFFYQYCHVLEGRLMELGLVIGFTDSLPIVTASNYKSLTELHTPSITVTTTH